MSKGMRRGPALMPAKVLVWLTVAAVVGVIVVFLAVSQRAYLASAPAATQGAAEPYGVALLLYNSFGACAGDSERLFIAGSRLAEGARARTGKWELLLIEPGHEPRSLWSGRGYAMSVWLAPDGSQLLVSWKDANEVFRVSWLNVRDGDIRTVAEVRGELLPFGLYGVTPWAPTGRQWLSVLPKSSGGKAIHFRDGKEIQLTMPVAWPYLEWPSGTGNRIYVLDRAGAVHVNSPDGDRVIGLIGRYDKRHVSAYGDYLFVFSPKSGTLTRYDLHRTPAEAQAVRLKRLSGLGSVDRIRAFSIQDVVLISYAQQDQRSTVHVSRLRFPASRPHLLWSGCYSRAIEEFSVTPSDMVSCTGDSNVTWVVWTDEHLNRTLVKRFPAPG